MNQTTAVLNRLETKGSITSIEAIELFGATRLADIIFRLRNKGYDIKTIMCEGQTRYGDACQYAKYVMRKKK